MGDADIPYLERALQGMLQEWRNGLRTTKPAMPFSTALWGVMQMAVYDIWCALEETRIYDVALIESVRMVHYYSPSLSMMLGKVKSIASANPGRCDMAQGVLLCAL